MRERWLKWIVLLTGILVLLASYSIATLRNLPGMEEASGTGPQTAAQAGRLVYQREGCARCHGPANADSAFAGIANRRTAQEIRQWIIAAAEVENGMPRRALLVKQGYRQMPDSDLAALAAFLQSLPP